MSKIDGVIEQYWEELKELKLGTTKTQLEQACKYLGPSLFRKDAATVAYSSADELARVRDSFVKKKLGITDSNDKIDAVIQKVGEKYGMSNRNKKRAIVYAMLMDQYGVKTL